MRLTKGLSFISASLFAVACGGDEGSNLFEEKPECTGAPVAAYAGAHPQVISKLEIGALADGFDLDGDGKPDNKLAAVASIANGAVVESIANYDIVIPIEFYDLQARAKDQCVKFALYYGDYLPDVDGDGDEPLTHEGDCNDNVASIKRGNPEVAGNLRDDNCNGLADEDGQNAPCTTGNCAIDGDGDGQTIAAGDCDDTLASVKKGAAEICGDGLDNDCDGAADRSGGMIATACSPFDPASQAEIPLDPLSLSGDVPVI
jgi:hypothetical protein